MRFSASAPLPRRAAWAWLRALLCLVAVLVGAALRGRGHVACAMDGALHFEACCVVAAAGDTPTLDDAPCCTHHAHDDAPALEGPPVADVEGGVSTGNTHAVDRSPKALAVPQGREIVAAAPPLAHRTRAGPAPPPRIARRLATLSTLRC